MTIFNLPNSITFIRIVLLPVFATAIIYKRYDIALGVFAVAAISDFLDGMVARYTNQQTKLGAFLDPLADKVLMTTSFVLFSVYNLIPLWLSITVISRDLIIVIGWMSLHIVYGISTIKPSLAGKTANALQLITIAWVLIKINNLSPVEFDVNYLYLAVAGFSIASALQYIIRAFRDSTNS